MHGAAARLDREICISVMRKRREKGRILDEFLAKYLAERFLLVISSPIDSGLQFHTKRHVRDKNITGRTEIRDTDVI